MAIRDKVTVRLKTGKPHITEVKRPGGKVTAYHADSFIKVVELTRKDKELDWTMFSADDVKSVEFKRGT